MMGSIRRCVLCGRLRRRRGGGRGRWSRCLSFQPWVATADAENLLFLARDAKRIGAPADVNEAERVAWVPLEEARDLVSRGEIVGVGTVIAVLEMVARKAQGEL